MQIGCISALLFWSSLCVRNVHSTYSFTAVSATPSLCQLPSRSICTQTRALYMHQLCTLNGTNSDGSQWTIRRLGFGGGPSRCSGEVCRLTKPQRFCSCSTQLVMAALQQ